ncbi:hypothetical protein GCM10008164_20580 [Achromobacter xylosoxidans]|nr:hypothetical protein GCM10008164_20580 [Achromobacter xylosoxidans]
MARDVQPLAHADPDARHPSDIRVEWRLLADRRVAIVTTPRLTKPDPVLTCHTRHHENAPPPARSAIARRKTPRKPQKAARAAGLGRAPQDTPTPLVRGQNAKHTARPSAREVSTSRACRVGGLRGAGRR